MNEPQVFIIESLTFEDEDKKKFEGRILSDILHLGKKKSLYYYIRTKKELREVLKLFKKSDYRYLHMSCHGSSSYIFTTLDEIPFSEFGTIINPYLKKRRLFISACSVVNDNLASKIFPDSGSYSLIGPTIDVEFPDAAMIWASFYHLMFKENPKAMKRGAILPTLRTIADTFRVPLNYYSSSRKSKKGYVSRVFRPRPSRKSK